MAGLVKGYWRYPESAKPSVFPTSSSMFTSAGFDLVLVFPTDAKHIYTSEILKFTFLFCIMLGYFRDKEFLDNLQQASATVFFRRCKDLIHDRGRAW